MEARAAARAWREAWEAAWPRHDADAIAGLYAENAVYRSHPFREPERSARDYALRAFADEESVECAFDDPLADGDLAAVRWWAVYTSRGSERTLSGVTLLRFDERGLVTEHTDYWAEADGRRDRPF